MDVNSPFASTVPIIGQPVVLNLVGVALVQCNCEAKTLLMGPIAIAPLACPSCKKVWIVQGEIQVSVQQIVNPVDSSDSRIIS